MQPPVVALACVCSARSCNSSVIIGDLHTGVFSDPKWRWASRLVLKTLRRRGFAIVPNEELAGICRQAGVDTLVSHGFVSPEARPSMPCPDGFVLAPLTYAFDEPVDKILSAAALLPHRRFVLTGRPPAATRRAAPENVHFTGFVSNDRYLQLRSEAALVVALTDQEMTMQSAGYEALADAKPLVTSPRRVLEQFFGESARYAESEGRSIALAIESVFADYAGCCARMSQRRDRQIENQMAVIEKIKTSAFNLERSRLRG